MRVRKKNIYFICVPSCFFDFFGKQLYRRLCMCNLPPSCCLAPPPPPPLSIHPVSMPRRLIWSHDSIVIYSQQSGSRLRGCHTRMFKDGGAATEVGGVGGCRRGHQHQWQNHSRKHSIKHCSHPTPTPHSPLSSKVLFPFPILWHALLFLFIVVV